MSTINSSDRIAATLYSLGTWFVSGIYVQILYIKEIVYLPIIIVIILIVIIIIISLQYLSSAVAM
jgi:hypothetical protein